jgi:methionine sulfoxide reductase heme-binding subunit
VNGHFWWLMSRSAGIVALLLIAASVLIGLTLATGLGGPPKRRRALVALHQHTANTGLAAIGLHGVTLLGDGWLKPGIAGIAIPFAMDYRPAYVASGIVAGYLGALLGLSFYARKRIGGRRWRKLHRATPLVYVLALIHTLGAGSDTDTPWLSATMLVTAVAAAGLLLRRLIRARAPAKISVTFTEI